MGMRTSVSVTEAQKQLPRIVRQDRVIAVTRRNQITAFVVPRARFDALLETMETLANPQAMRAIRRFKAGRMKFLSLAELDRELAVK